MTEPGGEAIYALDAQQADHDLLQAAAFTAFQLRRSLTDPTLSSADRRLLKAQLDAVPLVHGYSWFADEVGDPLPFVQLDSAMLMAIRHKLPYGVLKNYLDAVLPRPRDFPKDPKLCPWVISLAKRKELSAIKILMPSGCSRNFCDFVKFFREWTMEESAAFWCGVAPIVFDGAWTGPHAGKYYRLVTLLCASSRDILNARAVLEETKRGAAKLLLYGTLAEELYLQKLLPVELFTGNLSVLVTQVVRKATATGAPDATNEMFIERGVRDVVRCGANASKHVEAHVVRGCLRMKAALAAMAPLRKYEEQPGLRRRTGVRDEVGDENSYFFSSEGKPLLPKHNNYDSIAAEIVAYLEALGESVDAFTQDAIRPARLTQYFTLHHNTGKEVSSYPYRTRQKARISYFVSLLYRQAVLPPTLPEDAMRLLEAQVAVKEGVIGARVAAQFSMDGQSRAWYSGVVMSKEGAAKWLVKFWDGKRKMYTQLREVQAAVLHYAQHGRAALEAQHATAAVAAAVAGPIPDIISTEYARVERFIHVAVDGEEPKRLALVSIYKTTRPISDDKAYATVDMAQVLGEAGTRDVRKRVVDVSDIDGVVILVPRAVQVAGGGVAAAAAASSVASVVPFVKN
jgi:hypothetical protein